MDGAVRTLPDGTPLPDGLVHEGIVEVEENEPGDELWIDWEGPEEVLRLDITVHDKWGFYAFEQIFPWSLEIPHDDVHFDTGSHEIKDTEANTTGAKGLGEPVTIPTAAAIANAVFDATGVRVTAAPINPTRLVELLAAHDQRRV